jgi:hypothetical protein
MIKSSIDMPLHSFFVFYHRQFAVRHVTFSTANFH